MPANCCPRLASICHAPGLAPGVQRLVRYSIVNNPSNASLPDQGHGTSRGPTEIIVATPIARAARTQIPNPQSWLSLAQLVAHIGSKWLTLAHLPLASIVATVSAKNTCVDA